MNPSLANNPYAQYQQAQVDTAPPERLLIMLYDGAIRFANTAVKALNENDLQGANLNCIRVQNILTELIVTLRMDVGGELARNLFDLYQYMLQRMLEANLRKDIKPIEEVIVHLKELREAWAEAAKNVGALKSAQATA